MSKNPNTLTFPNPNIPDEPSILNAGATQAPAAPAAAAAPAFAPAPASGFSQEQLSAMQAEELMYRLEELREKRSKAAAEAARLKNMREQNMQQIKRQQREEALTRAMCSHLMEDGTSYTVGLRDHGRNLNICCQACRQEWHTGPGWVTDPEYDPSLGAQAKPLPEGKRYSPRIPRHLVPKPENVGGPSQA